MVHSSTNRSHRLSPNESRDGRRGYDMQNPRFSGPRSENYRKSPQRSHNSRQPRHDNRSERPARANSRSRGPRRGGSPRNGANGAPSERVARNNLRRALWRANRAKMRRMQRSMNGPGHRFSGGNKAPYNGRGRMAPRRMRMDDYPSQNRRPGPNQQRHPAMDHTVAKARREASNRTKDTYWTKKLLEAENSHPNRWAHSGFKELYRDELGFPVERSSERNSPSRDSREDSQFKRRRSSSVKRKKSPNSHGRYRNSRGAGATNGRHQTQNRARSPGARRRSSPGRKGPGHASRSRSISRGRRSRSYSIHSSTSGTTVTSRSGSRSFSSSSRSSFSSSSFSHSSLGSLRSYRRSGSSHSFSSSSSVSSKSRSKVARSKPPTVAPKTATNRPPKRVDHNKSAEVVVHESLPVVKPAPISIAKKKPRPIANPSIERRRPRTPETEIPIIAIGSPVRPEEYFDKDPPRQSPHAEIPRIKIKPDIHAIHESSLSPLRLNKQTMSLSNRFRQHPQHAILSEPDESMSDSSSEEEGNLKITLSERFGKLAQLSSQRQEYEGVKMKIVREGGQDKKVYLEGDSRSPSPGARDNSAHERFVRSHKEEYDEYEERYGQFRQWDPHRDLPRELPPNWDDVNVRYKYYKESGYFGNRSISMDDYLKWEDWWYRYRDWLAKYSDREQRAEFSGKNSFDFDDDRFMSRDRWIRRPSHRVKSDRKRHRY